MVVAHPALLLVSEFQRPAIYWPHLTFQNDVVFVQQDTIELGMNCGPIMTICKANAVGLITPDDIP